MSKPDPVRTVLSVAACKLTRTALRLTGRGGTAVPGKAAMKIAPNILEASSEGMKIIIVTRTNGKTTTCSMIRHALKAAGAGNVLENVSGANLLSGITADLTCNASWLGKAKAEYAVLECDEAALKQVAPLVHPKAIVVTNLFSDQVDRYGGVMNTLKEIRSGISTSPEAVLVLNAEEPLTASLAIGAPNRIVWYGLGKEIGVQGDIDLSDAGVCPKCGGDYTYDYHIYAHLGGFRCPNCGYKRARPGIEVTKILEQTTAGSRVLMRIGKAEREVSISLPAVYNIYNAAACIGAVGALSLSVLKAADSLSSIRSAFGRLETFDLNGVRLQMILVKNPAGCNQAFAYLTGTQEDYTAILALNNRTGDGHDISWIEDTDYERLVADPHLKQIYVLGECAKELYARLEKAGATPGRMMIAPDYPAVLDLIQNEKRMVFALPNYTAMMDMRKVLAQRTKSRDFWEQG